VGHRIWPGAGASLSEGPSDLSLTFESANIRHGTICLFLTLTYVAVDESMFAKSATRFVATFAANCSTLRGRKQRFWVTYLTFLIALCLIKKIRFGAIAHPFSFAQHLLDVGAYCQGWTVERPIILAFAVSAILIFLRRESRMPVLGPHFSRLSEKRIPSDASHGRPRNLPLAKTKRLWRPALA
jgi:hypothetical protein